MEGRRLGWPGERGNRWGGRGWERQAVSADWRVTAEMGDYCFHPLHTPFSCICAGLPLRKYVANNLDS